MTFKPYENDAITCIKPNAIVILKIEAEKCVKTFPTCCWERKWENLG